MAIWYAAVKNVDDASRYFKRIYLLTCKPFYPITVKHLYLRPYLP